MSPEEPKQTKQLLRSAPYFPVSDVERGVVYYERTLGFTREAVAGTPPEFAIVARDGFPIMLRLVADAERISPNERQGGTWDAFFWVSDVRALHDELRTNGATFAYDIVYQAAYEMDEFAVRDLNGYVLGFGQSRKA
jgi:catechol 2,3-dioxygenase-like lactoylglutathione lyase family enzyme